jgi:hypothetical protein
MDTPFAPGATVYIIDYTKLRRSPGYVNKAPSDMITIITPVTPAIIAGAVVMQDNLYWWPVTMDNGDWAGWVAESSPIDLPLVAAITPEQCDTLIHEFAAQLRLDPKIALAIFQVEAGPWAIPRARAIVRLEVHVLFDQITRVREFQEHFRFGPPDNPHHHHDWRPTATGTWLPVHRNQASERAAIAHAIGLFGAEPVYRSVSLGPGQIMARHYAKLGYRSALAMYQDWVYNYARQVDGFFRYIDQADLIGFLRSGDYWRFAYYYNGPANADSYARRIKEALRG